MELCNADLTRWRLGMRRFALSGLLLGLELILVLFLTGGYASARTDLTEPGNESIGQAARARTHTITESALELDVEAEEAQSLAVDWVTYLPIVFSSRAMPTFLQTMHFTQPAATIRIGVPLSDSLAASRTWVQIGQRNAYSPQMILGTLSAEQSLTFDPSSGVAFTPYFSYTVSPSKGYLVQVRTTVPGGLVISPVLQGGYYEMAQVGETGSGTFAVADGQAEELEWADGVAYIDRTHQRALPLVVEARPWPVDYSLAYVDSSHIQAVPMSDVTSVTWSRMSYTETAGFSVSAAEHAIALADLDGNEEPEIVRAVWDRVEARRITGELMWDYALPAMADQMLADDIDSDGRPEILVTTWIVSGTAHGRIVVLDQTGLLEWQEQIVSNAHAIAVWHPGSGEAGQVVVGNCANQVLVYSHQGVLLNQRAMVSGEWSSIDSLAVGDIDGDGQVEFVLGVWRIERADLWVLTPELETEWHLTLDSLDSSLGSLTIFDGIALLPAPGGGQYVWVATSPLDYNQAVDPILLQIDGRSAQVVAMHHLNRYGPVQGASDVTQFITVRAADWNALSDPAEVMVDVGGQLLVFGPGGLRGGIKLAGAEIINAARIGRRANGDPVIAVSYRSDLTGNTGIRVLANPQLFDETGLTFEYDAKTMQGQVAADITDRQGLTQTRMVDLNYVPVLADVRPRVVRAMSGPVTVTLTGANFVTDSVARWEGAEELATEYISRSVLIAAVPGTRVATAGTFTITVFTPRLGGGISEAQDLIVTDRAIYLPLILSHVRP